MTPIHRARASLLKQGLIDDHYRLTDSGNEWVRDLVRRLKAGARSDVPRPLQPATIYNNVDQKGDADGYSI